MRLSRDLIVVVFLFVVLVVLAFLAASLRGEPTDQPDFVSYSTHTAGAQGTFALQRWLEALGHSTFRIEGSSFSIPSDAQVLFIFRPSAYSESRDADAVMTWVARGNTLIVVDANDYRSPNALTRALKLGDPHIFDTPVERSAVDQPILGNLPDSSAQVKARHGLTLDRSDYVQYMSAQNTPLLVSFSQGKGKVWLASTPYLFTNDGLNDETNAALVGAMFSGSLRTSRVAFDEYHLGFRQAVSNEQTLQSLVYTTPWGWAILYTLVVVFAFLVINGQRFGRAQPLPQSIARRSPAEYVISLAQLYRRAGKLSIVQHHYYLHLKRRLGRPYRINPDLPNDEFVDALARQDDHVDREALTRTLRAFDQKQVNESGLVKLANQAIKLEQRRE
jgi:hypothetical protein